jgi:hypothetical protein
VVPSGEDARGTPTAAEALVTVLFTASIGALSLVTAGVAYLAFTQWLDNQQDVKDLKAFDSSVKACVPYSD